MAGAAGGVQVAGPFDRLSTADRARLEEATPGERLALGLFCEHLHSDWEILFQPALGPLRPDIMLLNPERGIAIFEVKDWRLDVGERLKERYDDVPVLPFDDALNPLEQVLRYKYRLLQVYIDSLDDDAGRGAITAGVIFPYAKETDVERYMEPALRARPAFVNHTELYPITGAESVNASDLNRIFPGVSWRSPKGMPPEAVTELKQNMRESEFQRARNEAIKLLPEQARLVETDTESGGRKLRGPAGSGKTLVLVKRALYLARRGTNVLLVSFNVTLSKYLAELVHAFEDGDEPGIVECTSFHRWASDLLASFGQRRMREAIFNDPDLTSDEKFATLVDRASRLSLHDPDGDRRWGAILIDEAQDFESLWVDLLRSRLAPDGQFMIAVDPAQDVYSRRRTWKGIPGRWNELRVSHRLPPEIVQLGSQFIHRYMPSKIQFAPDPRQQVLPVTGTVMRWHDARKDQVPHMAARLATTMVQDEERLELSPNDITVLVESNQQALVVTKALTDRGLQVITTAGASGFERSRLKKQFRGHRAGVKVTTIHSFKGWETRALITCISQYWGDARSELVYTALTRVKNHPQGSALYVVNSVDELRSFGRDHFARPLRTASGQRLDEL